MAIIRSYARSLRAAPLLPAGGEGYSLLTSLFGRATRAGRWVDDDSALTISAVYRSVAIIAGVSAALPIHVYTRRPDGSRQKIQRESERFLWGRPNPEVTRFAFWATVYTHLVMTGNAYIYVVPAPSATRSPAELWPIEPRRVAIRRGATGRKVYTIDGATPETDWTTGGSIVHIQGLGTDGLRGLSPISLFAQSLGITLAAEEFAGAYLGNSSTVNGYLVADQPISRLEAEATSAAWEGRHKGAKNAGRVAVLGKGLKWMTTTINTKDMQLLETRQWQVADVARMFGVPEWLLGSHDKTSSWGSGIAEQNQAFLDYTIDPYLINVEQTITDELLMLPENHYVKFDRRGLLRGNPQDRAEFLSKMWEHGAISADEWRELEDMPPLPGAQGDAYYVPLNYGLALAASGGEHLDEPGLADRINAASVS